MPQFGNNNFRKGGDDWLVIEADEYGEAFLHHRPEIIICTNIQADHLDYYKNFANVKKGFLKFFQTLKHGGILILNSDDKITMSDIFLTIVKKMSHLKKITLESYGTGGVRAKEIKRVLKVPGRHNLSNALAVDKLGQILKIPKKVRLKSISKFTGTWRRLEYKGQINGAKI